MLRSSVLFAGPLVSVLIAAPFVMSGCTTETEPPIDQPGGGDTTPPTILAITPIDGATDASPATSVVVVFSEQMAPASLAETAYSLSVTSGAVASSATLDGATLTITPDEGLSEATEYSVNIGTELTDVAGNALAESFDSVFTTGLTLRPVGEDVLYVGRFDDSDPDAVRLSWSGSGFVTRFQGTGARANLGGGSYFTVVIDGEVQPDPLIVTSTGSTYDLASDLPYGEHTVELYRREEGWVPLNVVGGVEVYGEPLEVPRPTRQIEIVGDSWSIGAGVDPLDGNCDGRATNDYQSWGSIAARAVDAELSNISLGGIGVVDSPIAPHYERVVATEAGSTGTIQPADVVFVDLGGNDLGENEDELADGFASAYASQLAQIRAQHSDALIACVFPRLDDPALTEEVRTQINVAIAERNDGGDAQVVLVDIELEELVDFSCDGTHPGVRTHEGMAVNTIAFLKDELGW